MFKGCLMRCPICDAKLEGGLVCKYCNITKDQIEKASNKKVKKYRKEDKADLIYFTNVIPKDVSKIKLILYTIFLGIFGVHLFYVNRYKRGLFSAISLPVAVFFQILKMTIVGFGSVIVLQLIYEIAIGALTFNLLFWIGDIIAIIFKGFKVPVVLGEKGDN